MGVTHAYLQRQSPGTGRAVADRQWGRISAAQLAALGGILVDAG